MHVVLQLLLLSLAACANGARLSMTNTFLTDHEAMSGDLRIGLQSVLSTASRKHRKHSHDDDDDDDDTVYMAIRFIVPAHEADDFEDKWEDLQEHCEKKEKVEHMSLKKTAMDNVVYWSYGEWESMQDLHDHFESSHFEDFSEWVDEHDIRWQMKLLDNESEEIEEEQNKKLGDKKKLRQHKDNTHILTHYYIPPGEADGFVKAWTKAAEDTIDEQGNLLYSLRKIKTENTRFVAYGTWESMSDWLDHHESKHLLKLHDYAADKDIIWWNEILETVEDEDDDDDDDDDDNKIKKDKKEKKEKKEKKNTTKA